MSLRTCMSILNTASWTAPADWGNLSSGPKNSPCLHWPSQTIEVFMGLSSFINWRIKLGLNLSLVAYALGITGIDPIEHQLFFERFLNPERPDLPDIDLDLCQRRRDEVLSYLHKKYGAEHMAQIGIFSTMGARGAVRDVGKALAVPDYSQEEKVLLERELLSISIREHPLAKFQWLINEFEIEKLDQLQNLREGSRVTP